MSAKQAINDKLQDSVAAYLRRGGVVNNQIKKGLLLSLLSLRIKKLKSVNIWQKLQAKTWLSRALSSSFSSVLARRAFYVKKIQRGPKKLHTKLMAKLKLMSNLNRFS